MGLIRKLSQFLLSRKNVIKKLRKRGAVIGENCDIYGTVDNGHEFLITLGNNVTLASGSRLIAHDGSTKKVLGYSKVGRIDIGNNVFIGAYAIVLPNVEIGSNVIIGAGAVVTKNIPSNSVVAGNPAKIIGTFEEFVKKNKQLLETSPKQDTPFYNKSSKEKIKLKKELSQTGYGFDA